MDWYDENGETMSIERWTNPQHRTLQYVATSTPEHEEFNRILLIVHGTERATDVTLPEIDGVTVLRVALVERGRTAADEGLRHLPGDVVRLPGTSMHLFRAD